MVFTGHSSNARAECDVQLKVGGEIGKAGGVSKIERQQIAHLGGKKNKKVKQGKIKTYVQRARGKLTLAGESDADIGSTKGQSPNKTVDGKKKHESTAEN